MNQLITELSSSFPITEVIEQKSTLGFLTVPKEQAVRLIRELRDRHGYAHLSFLIAIDYIEDQRFRLNYMLHNYQAKHTVGVHVDIDREQAEMESIHDLWAQAATYQRELREMYGIRFPGSPRLDEDFCLEGWEDVPPMRREFDTVSYSEEMFSSRPGRATDDPRDYMREQMYPTHKD